jgi:pyrimidine-specific ribonucleoside hydrolase
VSISLIIDTDPGVDDAFALALAASSPEVDLIGVTTVFGNVPLARTTDNALRLLSLFGRDDVPVAAGADRPLVHPLQWPAHAHGSDGLSGRADTLPPPGRDVDGRDAVTLLVDLLTAAPSPVTIVAVGPLTNVALLLAAHPGLRSRIARLVVMGGGIAGGNATPSAEFNIASDPEAARRVLVEEDLPTVLVPLDLTMRCAVDTVWLGELAESGPVGETLVGLTPTYRAYYQRSLGFDGLVMHDALAVAEAVRPGVLTTARYPLDVDCTFGPGRGSVVPDRRPRSVSEEFGVDQDRAVDFAVDTDLDGLRSFVLERLKAL